jgi:hypothetical protein
MKNLILILLLISFSCKEKVSLTEKSFVYSDLIEPQKNIYIELLSYYPSTDEKQSNFYLVKDIYSNDTLYVIDKDDLPISDFIKNYDGVENTAIVLKKGNAKNKKEYIINIPKKFDLNNKKIYLGELFKLID